MKNLLIACSCILLAAAESFAGTNNVPATSKVDLVELSKHIERIERILELEDFPTYCEFTNAVWTVVKNRNCVNHPIKSAAYKVIRRAGVDLHLFDDPPTGYRITHHKKRDLVENLPKEGQIRPGLPRRRDGLIRKTLDDFEDEEFVPWRTNIDDSYESRLKNCNPLLSDR